MKECICKKEFNNRNFDSGKIYYYRDTIIGKVVTDKFNKDHSMTTITFNLHFNKINVRKHAA